MVAAVLAGGAGRRMGGAKATARLGAAPLAARPVTAARAAGLEPVLVAKPSTALPDLGVPVWLEPEEPRHPLCGVVAALERAGGPVLCLACDQPWLAPGALAALAAGADAAVAVPEVRGGLEPFPGRYTLPALPALRAALAAQAPLRATLAALAPARVDLTPWGDPERLVRSLNTPEALAAAEAELAAAEAQPDAPDVALGAAKPGFAAGDDG